jgi:hypothetical protein
VGEACGRLLCVPWLLLKLQRDIREQPGKWRHSKMQSMCNGGELPSKIRRQHCCGIMQSRMVVGFLF